MTRAKSKLADGLEADEAVDPGPPVKASQRQFTEAYKLAVLEEIGRVEGPPGAVGEVSRREVPYSSHLVDWRRQPTAGLLAGLSSQQGRTIQDPLVREMGRLRRGNTRLEGKLAKAERVIDGQGKVSALLHDLARESAEGSRPA